VCVCAHVCWGGGLDQSCQEEVSIHSRHTQLRRCFTRRLSHLPVSATLRTCDNNAGGLLLAGCWKSRDSDLQIWLEGEITNSPGVNLRARNVPESPLFGSTEVSELVS
jgi:hypothetical protein